MATCIFKIYINRKIWMTDPIKGLSHPLKNTMRIVMLWIKFRTSDFSLVLGFIRVLSPSLQDSSGRCFRTLSSFERSVQNPNHLFRQGCPSWYVWQCLFVDIFGCRIEYALHKIMFTHLSGFCLCHTCPGVYTCALLYLLQVFEGTQGMLFVGCLDTNHSHILLPYL